MNSYNNCSNPKQDMINIRLIRFSNAVQKTCDKRHIQNDEKQHEMKCSFFHS